MRHLLSVSGPTPEQEYEINDKLFASFTNTNSIRPSFTWAQCRSARRLGNHNAVHFELRPAVYSSTGMSVRQKRMLDSIDRHVRSPHATCCRILLPGLQPFCKRIWQLSQPVKHFRELEERCRIR